MAGKRARAIVPWALAALLGLGVAIAFAPWVRSGRGSRSSFEAVRTADRLDLFDDSVQTVVAVVWAALPFVAALGAVAVALGWSRVAAASGMVVGSVVLVVGALVALGPPEAEWGATAGLVVGVLLVGVALIATVVPEGEP